LWFPIKELEMTVRDTYYHSFITCGCSQGIGELEKINRVDRNRFSAVRFLWISNLNVSNIRNAFLFLIAFFWSTSAVSQVLLSAESKVSIITCGPGKELYEAFGHSAVRVTDPRQNLDLVFNYGVFDFNQPNFYGNFAKGSMLYKLGLSNGPDFLNQYQYYNRSVREQILNLDSTEKQKIMNYLDWNLRPENVHYYYDYFDNNCSTKIIELLDSALQRRIIWNFSAIEGKASFRSLIYDYTTYQVWGRLGIDLGLGAVIDKTIDGRQLNFLPDELEKSISRAMIQRGMVGLPLVSESKILFEAPLYNGGISGIFKPEVVFTLLLLVCVVAWFFSFQKLTRVLRFILFIAVGLLGWVELIIWLFTNHKSAAWNLNLFWANPLFIFMGIILSFRVRSFPRLAVGCQFYLGSVLIFWFFIPQTLNTALIPLVASLFILCFPHRQKLETGSK